jgi:hypothetical protein
MEPVSPEAIFLQGGEDKGEAREEDECVSCSSQGKLALDQLCPMELSSNIINSAHMESARRTSGKCQILTLGP